MFKKLMKNALFLAAALLLAPTHALADISCAPEEFSLEIDQNEPEYGYVIGELQTPKQEYTYRFGTATDPNEKGISYIELSLNPPTQELLYEHVDSVDVEDEIYIPDGAKYLVILVKGDFSWGPEYFIGKIPDAGYGTCMKMKMKSTQ